MKYRSILLLMLVIVTCSFFAGCGGGNPVQVVPLIEETTQSITFLHDHANGLEVARQERKPTLIFFSVPDNAGSQRMLETTFRDDEIQRLAEWLVCIHVDGSQESTLCESLGISSFPTIILSNANGTEVRRLVGRQTADQLAVQIHILLQAVALRPQGIAGR
jgi:hypothetical protein